MKIDIKSVFIIGVFFVSVYTKTNIVMANQITKNKSGLDNSYKMSSDVATLYPDEYVNNRDYWKPKQNNLNRFKNTLNNKQKKRLRIRNVVNNN